MEAVDYRTAYCEECLCEHQYYRNAWNDEELSLAAKLLWTLISEREEGFDHDEYLDNICQEDAIYEPIMELVNKGYFDFSFLEVGAGG